MAMKERGISFKEALNSAVRAGLTQTTSGPFLIFHGRCDFQRLVPSEILITAHQGKGLLHKVPAQVIIVDVSLLIYAVNEDAPDHRKAKSWLEGWFPEPRP
jgi:hypothetical protein